MNEVGETSISGTSNCAKAWARSGRGQEDILMKKLLTIFFVFSCFTLHGWCLPASAHQPRIVQGEKVSISNPEISKAYYGVLSGKPHLYKISSNKDFKLYVNVLVPDIEGQKKDVSADIFKEGETIAVLNADDHKWRKFFEPFGQSTYWQGPEYKALVKAGEYVIRVRSTERDIKYSLAIGEIEAFDVKEGIKAILLIPDLKKRFFNESPASFILSPLGWGYILLMYVFAFVVGFICSATFKKITLGSHQGFQKNIGVFDRIIRFAVWLGLLVWAIITSWNPILLFFSGFALYEALFCWCGLYAALGRNTYPMKSLNR